MSRSIVHVVVTVMQLSVLRIPLQFLLLFVVFQQVPTAMPSRKKKDQSYRSLLEK